MVKGKALARAGVKRSSILVRWGQCPAGPAACMPPAGPDGVSGSDLEVSNTHPGAEIETQKASHRSVPEGHFSNTSEKRKGKLSALEVGCLEDHN